MFMLLKYNIFYFYFFAEGWLWVVHVLKQFRCLKELYFLECLYCSNVKILKERKKEQKNSFL